MESTHTLGRRAGRNQLRYHACMYFSVLLAQLEPRCQRGTSTHLWCHCSYRLRMHARSVASIHGTLGNPETTGNHEAGPSHLHPPSR